MGIDYARLAEASLKQLIDDYIDSVKKLAECELRLERRLTEPQEPIKQKKGENKYTYKMRKYRHSVAYFEREVYKAEERLVQYKEEFDSCWIFKELDINGQAILEECNNKLKQEGYEVE